MLKDTAKVRMRNMHRRTKIFHVEIGVQILQANEMFNLFKEVGFAKKFSLRFGLAHVIENGEEEGSHAKIRKGFPRLFESVRKQGKHPLRMTAGLFDFCQGEIGVRDVMLCKRTAKLKKYVLPRIVLVGIIGKRGLVVKNENLVRINGDRFSVYEQITLPRNDEMQRIAGLLTQEFFGLDVVKIVIADHMNEEFLFHSVEEKVEDFGVFEKRIRLFHNKYYYTCAREYVNTYLKKW